ncbi:MAG: aminotransferase class V-fold PLP-dependent enzyme [Rhodospirillales bacterium]|nr:aminotransferase class V-fold PLP-dependent enzyme [Rhodospirillales bacterium]
MIPCQRPRFPIPQGIAYFNCAYMSPLANDVLAAVSAGAALKAAPWDYRPEDFFTHAERARGAFADLADCDPEAIALVPSASYGLAIAARNLPLRRGQRILVLDGQFPSNVYVWRERASETGGSVETVTRAEDQSWAAALLERLADDVAIVAVPNCHWADGSLIDLGTVAAACRKFGAALVVDATQSLGAMPIDLSEVQPDFLVAAAYKWLMAPYGTGMLYVAPQHRGGTPIEHNWINRGGSEDFARLVDYRDDFQPGARRFDMGEKANPPLLMGVVAAADMLLEWGVERIAATLEVATDQIAARAGALGFETFAKSDRSPHLLSIRFPGAMPQGVGSQLAAKGVHLSVRGQSLRIAPQVYNNDADIDRLIDALAGL